ncbi:MAG: IS1380 family transposase [Phycisphaerae bacterium]|nr:IS1380 family transposase [Phycisphaerae bacterium]
MTECNGLPLVFSSLGRKTIQADFAGGKLTSDAGAALLREVDRRIGLINALADCITDPRQPAKITHDLRTMLAQRILAMAMGYEDLNDHDSLRDDPLLQILSERGVDEKQPLASASTLCRLENSLDRKSLAKMAEVFVEQFIGSHPKAPERIVPDFDATDDPVHGNQQGRFFHGYYDHYCFLPLYVFCGQQLLVAYLRPSKIDAAKHSRAILKLLVRRFRQAWPKVKIIFRGDSGFCRWKLLRWCDRHDIGYIVGLAKNEVLKHLAEPHLQLAKKEFEQTGQKQRIFAESQYAAATWDRKRRVIIKAEHNSQGSNPRFVVTNLAGDPQALYDDLYCQRGDMENRIKEQQLDLFAGRTSCHEFLANQFRLLLSSAAYVLIESLRRLGLKGTELAKAQAGTIRLKLLKIGARISCSVRRIVLHLAGGYPLKELFARVLSHLRNPLAVPT